MASDHDGSAATGCTADRFGWHDYSQPPHSTPEEPVVALHDDWDDCWTQSYHAEPCCAHRPDYEVTIYQPGTHEWVWLLACEPCVTAIRSTEHIGPNGKAAIARIRTHRPEVVA